MRSELVPGHLVDALAELADRVRDHRHTFKHLPRDRVNDIQQLDDHFFVEFLLAGVRDHGALVSALGHARGRLPVISRRHRVLRLLRVSHATLRLLVRALVALVSSLQVLHREEAGVYALALLPE